MEYYVLYYLKLKISWTAARSKSWQENYSKISKEKRHIKNSGILGMPNVHLHYGFSSVLTVL